MSKVIGRKIIHETVCNFENGVWNSSSKITEGRLLEGADKWEETWLESQAMDRSFSSAYGLALNSVLEEFLNRTIKKGFDSLLESNEHTNKIKNKEKGLIIDQKAVSSDELKDKSN